MTRVIPKSELPSADTSAAGLAPGMRLGRYELLAKIAEGGMAQVWAAEQTGDLGFRKLIALKTIRPDFAHDASFRAMFLDEAQLASRIRHANVVEVLDLGVDGDVVYQAMALIEGTSLSEWSRAKRVPLGVAVRIAIDMLRGLHAAHELRDDDGNALGLVHRDVSPQNVLVGTDGVAKLADFGIAKAFGRATEETVVGDVKGKLSYVAPEQLRGFPAAPQSDLFSAGVVFWELLTGDRLFRMAGSVTPSAREAMKVRDPRSVARDVPAAMAEIVMRALRDNPFERYETSLEMADALEEAVRAAGVDASHRHVAARLEADLGPRIEQRREELRSAKKRSTAFTGPPTPRGHDSIKTHLVDARTSTRTRLETAATQEAPTAFVPTPEADLPQTRVIDPVAFRAAAYVHEAMTDSVAVSEPQLRYATADPPSKKSNAHVLPLVLAAAMLLAVLVTAATMRQRTEPVQPAATAPPVVVTAPPPPPPPLTAEPILPPSLPVASVPPPAASSATVVHRPIITHGRTRPAPKPNPASPATAAPRFENPY